MSLIRATARPLQASMFLYGGLGALRRPDRVAAAAEPVVRTLAGQVPVVPRDTVTAIRLNAGVQVVAALALATGRATRLSALALAATLVPVTWAGHRFWAAEDEAERARQRIHFFKNLSMLGGLLVTAADNGAGPTLAWRARHGLHRATGS
ncbi:DoxX family membrane protein [Kitasatospora sp. NPDC094015]|uniref:DoxX family membrane protein n=1 Tax=Kitasatospora sp. NPDC094015 TaxID=3155205 RepID=UPI0033294AEE